MIAVMALLAALVGTGLVLLGAGGSIVTVPILIYVGGLGPERAAATSLVIVGIVALVGVVLRRRLVDLRTGLLVGGLGMIGTVPGVWLSHHVPDVVTRLGFAMILLVAAASIAGDGAIRGAIAGAPHSFGKVVVAGLLVGVGSGFFGVGGGFLIVPALTMLIGLDVAHAIPTSLFVIALNSVAGVAGHLAYGAVAWDVGGRFAVAALIGAALAVPLARRVPPVAVRRAFATICVALAIGIVADSLRTLA